jgi:hypothetical protein
MSHVASSLERFRAELLGNDCREASPISCELDSDDTLGPVWERLTRAHAAQGGITLGLEQGEPGADFSSFLAAMN